MISAPRIFIGIASSGLCNIEFTLSLARLISYFQSQLLTPEAESQELTVESCVSSGIAHNYHQLVLLAQKWKATHLLTLEEDHVFAPQILHILYSKRQLWTATNYPIRNSNPFEFTACRSGGSGRIITDENSYGLEEASYTGMGCALFDMQIFEKVEPPWFLMAWVGENQYCTQDAWFGDRVRAAGIQPFVDHDASKLIQHIGRYVHNWQETAASMRQREKDGQRTDLENNIASSPAD